MRFVVSLKRLLNAPDVREILRAAENLYKQADLKFAAALRINPGDGRGLNNWGNALARRAQRANDPEKAERLLKEAEAKYRAASWIKQHQDYSLVNLGAVLGERARRVGNSAIANKLFDEAEAACKRVLRTKPNAHEALRAYGGLLLERAKLKSDRKRMIEVLTAAKVHLEKSRKLGNTYLYNLACVYALLGQVEDCQKTLEAAEKTGKLPRPDHLEKDSDLKSVRHRAWFGQLIQRWKKNWA